MELFFFLLSLIGSFIVIVIAYVVGSIIEKNHYDSIKQREKLYLNLPTVCLKKIELDESNVKDARLVYGSAVISIDHFKRFLSGLINIFGGKVIVYESLLDRARREAILRMKEMAADSDVIINLKLENASIGKTSSKDGKKKSIGCVEVLAYGTAITYKNEV